MSQESRLSTTKMRNTTQATQHSSNASPNEKIKSNIEETINLLGNVLKDIQQNENDHSKLNNGIHNFNYTPEDKNKNVRKNGNLPEKVFTARNSLLTDLLEIPHIRTIYHIFIVILIILFCNTILYDLMDRGSINIGFGLIRTGFGKMDKVIAVWGVMQLVACLPFWAFKQWAAGRPALAEQDLARKFWDAFWLSCYVVFQVSFLVIVIVISEKIVFPIASALVVIIEMIRFIMKIHAYVRSVAPRVLSSTSTSKAKSKSKSESLLSLPSFSWYIYFMFAPTIVYRDSYPRTGKIRWGVACVRLLEVGAMIFYVSFLIERFAIAHWSSFGTPDQIVEAEQLVLSLFGSMLPGLLVYVCGFYLLLHCWHNVTAELLTFADRRFYMDWWNQTSYAAFYRMWNMVVHDWLYVYIFRDVLLLTGNRLLSTLVVFTTSAIIHEVVLTYAFGFFYPVLLIFFGFFGVMFVFLTKNLSHSIGNIFIWLTLAVGNGLLLSFYSMEYFARLNCPIMEGEEAFPFLPRSWSCHNIVLKPGWEFHNPLKN